MTKILFKDALGICALGSITFLVSSCSHFEVADSYNEKAKTFVVKANMRLVQKAAEDYFKDHTYMYPIQIDDDFKSYFQGGDPKSKKPGHAPNNPFTGQDEWPVLGTTIVTTADLEKARQEQPGTLKKGVLEYSSVDSGKSYAIRGGADSSKAIGAEDGGAESATVIISRDSKPPG